jgi:structural maintenance of chromosome 1
MIDLFRKTLLAAEKTHAAHDEEIEKYENDLREVERLRKEYEDKLQDESQNNGRNLSLEEDQVYRLKQNIFSKLMNLFRLDERISTFERRSSERNDTIFGRI